jgi:NAD(P)-dependent dehydrogenase (short-subunit alcohol dehydrogenase family)
MAVALITGTSSGIGLATAVHFARQGHEVWAGVRNPATATDLHEAIDRERLPIHLVTLDVDDAASVQRGVGEVHDKAGRVDVLVNNAGIGGGGPIEEVPVDWAHVSSIAGRLAIAGHGHYSAVKHALEAMSEALAQEVQGFGIRVAIVEPGVVVTPIFSKAKRWADATSPYADHVRRLLLFYQKQMKQASQPADAARVLYEAATTTEPRLRWLVGEDARLLVDGRRRMSDEEYLAGARPMPDEEYLAEMQRRFGFDWS